MRAKIAFLLAFTLTAGLSVFATTVPLGLAANYAVLYTGGHNLSITNVTINGNVGVGGNGVVNFSGPSTINGRLDFAAANIGQFHNTNNSNIGPTAVNYGVGDVTTALSTMSSLSSSLTGGHAIAINGTQTIDASTGLLATIGGITYRIFNVTSYSSNDGKMLTINGDGSGAPVVLNFAFNSNVNLKGDVTLNGLAPDQVLWNFTTSGKNVNLNTNASSHDWPLSFKGIILAPHDKLSMTNANLEGRFFGGGTYDMGIVSGATIKQPPRVPEPASLLLLIAGVTAVLLSPKSYRK